MVNIAYDDEGACQTMDYDTASRFVWEVVHLRITWERYSLEGKPDMYCDRDCLIAFR